MQRAFEVVALRALGLSLAQVARALDGDDECLAGALATHQTILEAEIRQRAAAIQKVQALRSALERGDVSKPAEIGQLLATSRDSELEFTLPWPWGGERFALTTIRPITYIVGPLGSGKTILAQCIAANLPKAVFLGLDRLEDDDIAAKRRRSDPDWAARIDHAIAWLIEDGATPSKALTALLAVLEARAKTVLVVDMVEQGLDLASQEALSAYLRRRGSAARPLFLMTRSNAILDLAAIGPHEAILYCPANHSPPIEVEPVPGASGYEALATCLASPEVRARTEGVIAWRPPMPNGGRVTL
jgi:DNA-binding transcriptional MerR regulator